MNKVARAVQVAVLIIASSLLVAHVLGWERLRIDGVTLSLLAFILVVPVIDLVRKIRLGEFEAEIAPREVARAVSKARTELEPSPSGGSRAIDRETTLKELVSEDPRLGLAKLRIEIEERVRSLRDTTELHREGRPLSLSREVEELGRLGRIPPQVVAAIRDVLPLANRVIHGENVRQEDAESLIEIGARILDTLDWIHRETFSPPSETILLSTPDVEELRSGKYRLSSVVPLVDGPYISVRNLNQEELNDYLDRYNEFAEFIIEVTRIDEAD